MSQVAIERRTGVRVRAGRADAVKGLVCGALGGLVACWAMDRLEAVRHSLRERRQPPDDPGASGSSTNESSAEDSTVKVARGIARAILHRDLRPEERNAAGLAVHYGFGTSVAACYGALCEGAPEARRGSGTPFGTAVWLLANEIAVPAFRLGPRPTKVPLSEHAFSLTSHLLYGFIVESVRRALRGEARSGATAPRA